MSDWLRSADGGVTLTLHIQPGAKRTEVAGEHGDALKIRLAAPPVDGKANQALIGFLAESLHLPRSDVRIKSGETARRKVIHLAGVTPEMVQNLLGLA